MKVEKQLLDIDVNVESDECTIEATPEMFDFMVANIYRDRPMAPVRELSANAFDAHKMAGNVQTPFEVHAPNSLEPYFAIRDYGIGISPDQMHRIYKKIGKSDKTKSNDYIGCMGVGSKSPFAYLDSYTVTSFYQGKKYQYICFRNKKRKPAITKAVIEDTTEPDGVEVRFAVKNWDCSTFAEKIKQAFRFYNTKPIVKGIANFEHMVSDYLVKNAEYGITARREKSLVVMGQIAYPFSVEDFARTVVVGKSEYEDPDDKDDDVVDDEIHQTITLNSKERKLVNYGVHLFVPIGSVMLAPSRESLTYTPKTQAFVKEILGKAVEATEAEASKALAEAKTLWEARCLFGKIRNGVIGEICDFDNTNFVEWNGQNISNVIVVSDYNNHPSVEMLSLEEGEGRRGRRKPPGTSANGMRKWHTSQILAEDTKVIFVNDLNRGGYAAAKRYMEDNDIEKAMMFSHADDAFIDQVGCRHLLINVSTLPKPERKKRGSSGSSDRSLLQEWSNGAFTNVEVELEDGGIYVEMRRDKIKRYNYFKSDNFDYENSHSISLHAQYLRDLGNTDPIYGIRPCDLNRLQRHKDEWVTLDQAVEDAVRQNAHLVSAARYLKTFGELSEEVLALDGDLADGSVLRVAIDTIKECAAEGTETPELKAFIKLNEYVRLFKIEVYSDKIAKVEAVNKTYPLLKEIGYLNGRVKPAVLQYVKLIDESKEAKELAVA